VEHEVIYDLYMPDVEIEEGTSNSRVAYPNWIDRLLDEAYHITGNDKVSYRKSSEVESNLQMSRWRPAGFVNYQDSLVVNNTGTQGWVGIEGAEVRATRFTKTVKGFTQSNGRFQCDGTFKREARYSIVWDRYHFSVGTGSIGQAVYTGPKKKGDLYTYFTDASTEKEKHKYYAIIFQGAFDYYYTSRFGLAPPPLNAIDKPQSKIAAEINYSDDKRSHAANYARTGGLAPTQYVRRWRADENLVYGTTIHELAHSAHWNLDRDRFRWLVADAYVGINPFIFLTKNFRSEVMIESWAECVEWVFTNNRYQNHLGIAGFNHNEGNQTTWASSTTAYTSLFKDLIDNLNQNAVDSARPIDNVEGYSISQIDHSLRGSTFNTIQNRLMTDHVNTTWNNIPELFDNWDRQN
jgi:hypothetical protein